MGAAFPSPQRSNMPRPILDEARLHPAIRARIAGYGAELIAEVEAALLDAELAKNNKEMREQYREELCLMLHLTLPPADFDLEAARRERPRLLKELELDDDEL